MMIFKEQNGLSHLSEKRVMDMDGHHARDRAWGMIQGALTR
jgi:hypothetical protein